MSSARFSHSFSKNPDSAQPQIDYSDKKQQQN